MKRLSGVPLEVILVSLAAIAGLAFMSLRLAG